MIIKMKKDYKNVGLLYFNAIKVPPSAGCIIFALKKYMQFNGIKSVEDVLADRHNP
jgi:hypothetical protein